MARQTDFIKGMNLTKGEIDTVERYMGLIEQADKNKLEFLNSNQVAFTPAALLVVAVAKFAYDVYQDYGSVAVDPDTFQQQFKLIAQELHRIECVSDDLPGLDVYASLREELIAAKNSREGIKVAKKP